MGASRVTEGNASVGHLSQWVTTVSRRPAGLDLALCATTIDHEE
jgi:hypothetical protein